MEAMVDAVPMVLQLPGERLMACYNPLLDEEGGRKRRAFFLVHAGFLHRMAHAQGAGADSV